MSRDSLRRLMQDGKPGDQGERAVMRTKSLAEFFGRFWRFSP
jgi:hypothetical protein